MRKWIALFLVVAACGSVQVFEMPKLQSNLATTLRRSEDVAQKAQTDYAEKKALIDNLAKSSAPAYKQNEKEISQRLRSMDEALQDIVVAKKKMSDANADVVSLAYAREKVRSDEKEYPRVEESVKSFEASAAELNSSVVDYSRESNSMADLITNKKLYYYFDVSEFQKRVQRNITVAQDNQRVMERELKRSEAVLNSSKSDKRAKLDEIYAEMRAAANDYSTKANRFAEINREVNSSVMGAAKISSLDPHWTDVQKLVAEFDNGVRELADINERFLAKVDSFRNPSRRMR